VEPRSRAALPPSRLAALLTVIGMLSIALPLQAQTDPRLVEAVRLAQEGMGDSARASVNRVLNQLTAGDSLYPQALYTLGLVSRSVDEMRRQYTRVAVEYTYSDWADKVAASFPAAFWDAGRGYLARSQCQH